MHVVAEYYIKENSYQEYIQNEIDASIESMKRNGFTPLSFAYPYGSKYWFTDFLLRNKFKMTRSVASLNAEQDLTTMDEIYFSFNGDRSIFALGIDQKSPLTKI